MGKIELEWSPSETTYIAKVWVGLPFEEGTACLAKEFISPKKFLGHPLDIYWGVLHSEWKNYRWWWQELKGKDPKALQEQGLEMLEKAFKFLENIAKRNRERSSKNRELTVEKIVL